jgi:hypothetical protein
MVFPGCSHLLNLRIQNHFPFPVSVFAVDADEHKLPPFNSGNVAANSARTFERCMSDRLYIYQHMFKDASGKVVAEDKATLAQVQHALVDDTYTVTIGPTSTHPVPASSSLAVQPTLSPLPRQTTAATGATPTAGAANHAHSVVSRR